MRKEIYSDNQIMLKVKAGDVSHLGLLYEKYKKMLFGFFYKMNRDTAVCEDMIQVVFVKIIKSKHCFTGNGEFSVWLFTIARNVGYDNYRKNKQAFDDINNYENSIESSINVENDLIKQENIDLLEKALEKLKYTDKEIIVMSRFKNLKYQEIGKILGVSEGAIKMKMSRALFELKRIYSKLEKGEYND